jgi:membrane protein implicated in regulation of membrane protease activity
MYTDLLTELEHVRWDWRIFGPLLLCCSFVTHALASLCVCGSALVVFSFLSFYMTVLVGLASYWRLSRMIGVLEERESVRAVVRGRSRERYTA